LLRGTQKNVARSRDLPQVEKLSGRDRRKSGRKHRFKPKNGSAW
jgi:hypothetical protein